MPAHPQRILRNMNMTLAIVLSLPIAAAVAWIVRRVEVSRVPKPTHCEAVLKQVFASDTSDTRDSTRLAKLLEHQEDCQRDASYVSQLSFLLLRARQVSRARTLLDEAEAHQTFRPDHLAAERAWVDLAAAHEAWNKDSLTRAQELFASAVRSANALSKKWPEWPIPFQILGEAARYGWANDATAQAKDSVIHQAGRGDLPTGAFVRDQWGWQPVFWAFVITLVGMVGAFFSLSSVLSVREMTGLVTSPIAEAQPGYVELKGTLHVMRGATAVSGPNSRSLGVWYEVKHVSGFKNSVPTYDRTWEPFVVRDATGDAVVDPRHMTVHTYHVDTKTGMSGGHSMRSSDTERMLKEGDSVYVLGELRDETAPDGSHVRTVRVAQDGRRLLVSNMSEESMVFFDYVWMSLGAGVFVLSVLLFAWSAYQRYFVIALPGR